jgi:GntR family transcriptional regulator/MocR family aminotransferase
VVVDQARSSVLVELRRGTGPLQGQVEAQLRAAIRTGRLRAGERLPASRALAADLGVSRGVVSDAYAQLAAEGWLVTRSRSAPRVAAVPARPSPPVPEPAVGERFAFDLRPGRPDLAGFPRREWGRAVAEVLRTAPDAALDYPPPEGVLELREVLAAYRGRVRGVDARAADVLVTAGAGQALMVVADVLRARGGRRVCVEDPGHAEVRALLARRGLEVVPVPVDDGGLVVDALPAAADAVLVTPAHQFPLGVVLSAERRAGLLAWAAGCGAVVVEDDYDAEYRYDRAPVGALQGLRPELVVHLGTTSKTLAPALRIGWIVAPPSWHAELVAAKADLDHGLPVLEQLALAAFITRGGYDRHLRRAGRLYRARRDALVAALASELPGARVSGAAAGLHTAVAIPGVASEEALVAACAERGLAVDRLGRHAVGAGGPPTLLLSFARVPEASAARVASLLAASTLAVS